MRTDFGILAGAVLFIAIIERAGVHFRRAFGFAQVPAFDPFLIPDDTGLNTNEELRVAFEEYNNGTFVKQKTMKR